MLTSFKSEIMCLILCGYLKVGKLGRNRIFVGVYVTSFVVILDKEWDRGMTTHSYPLPFYL
jgi:hypothetical protein